MSDTKIFIAVVAALVLIMLAAQVLTEGPGYEQATGIIPQVVSCLHENPSNPKFVPTLRVKVEPVRDIGRVREYHVLGCTLHYYHAHF